jgi:uncharacterized protein YbbC (DUF1343 family)/CubicO group peptidase (beta-lactamase class C family)
MMRRFGPGDAIMTRLLPLLPLLLAADFAPIDAAVNDAITRGDAPGAVVLVLHRGEVVYRKAFGDRVVRPTRVPMTPDTVFDLASLTKPIATATTVMRLIEQGKLKPEEPVAKHWPAFGKHGKDRITVAHLLLHVGGLIADNPVADYTGGRDAALERVAELRPLAAPGERFVYSDVNFIVLGHLVERLTGKTLDEAARESVFVPLGLSQTSYKPAGALRERAAPTEARDGQMLAGEVHDPRAAKMGGVAGHAGLFGTADDLATYARMLLDGGRHDGKPFLAPETLKLFTTPHAVPRGKRAYGWDVDTGYSAPRGERFPRGTSFGHTGFTGTSIWIDPASKTAVIILSSRLHPDGKGNVTRLRREVATRVAAALGVGTPEPGVKSGLDVLVGENFARLRGRRVGLVTNHTGRDRRGHSAIDLLHAATGVKLVALFSPEHGIRGALDEKVADGKDAKTGLPVYSLYGERRKPSAETLEGIDTLVFDIQDAGCRFYTYLSTMGLVMEAAAERGLTVVVLDRPNPLGGAVVEGPTLDAGRESFVGFHRVPVRHGLTAGEMARLFNAERRDKDGKPVTCKLEVVAVEGWRRGDTYDRTLLPWVNPSPNLRSLGAMLLYPGLGLVEYTNVSVGRGTDRPFEWVGAPWIDGRRLAAALAAEGVPGVRFVPTSKTPGERQHAGTECGGVAFVVDDWSSFRPVRLGVALMATLRRLYPEAWDTRKLDTLLLNKATAEAVRAGRGGWRELEQTWAADVAAFAERARPHRLYGE